MKLKRRDFLFLFGASVGSATLNSCFPSRQESPSPNGDRGNKSSSLKIGGDGEVVGFEPVQGYLPLETDGFSEGEQIKVYGQIEVVDDLVLPKGYTYDVIAAWGEPLGDSRFGYNNDYLSFVETGENEGFLTINFEYISGGTWMATYEEVIGKSLPFGEVKEKLAANEGEIDAFALQEDDPLRKQIEEIAKEGLIDQGIGVISLSRDDQGKWSRTNSKADRRITGISGLTDGHYLQATGPGVAVFSKENKQGYEDNLGDRIIGTFQNCSGGTTPWGTVLSAEENFQDQVPEPVRADGSSLAPEQRPFLIDEWQQINGRGNVFGLAGNKYGWMVEIDPANPDDYGTKHTWLGRYRHEAVGVRAEAGKKLAVYSGCDRRSGHVYKFVSQQEVKDIKDKANSDLFTEGMLYGAKFNGDGTGSWIPLNPSTPINPVLPSQVVGKDGESLVTLPNPDREVGGIVEVKSDGEVKAFQEKFPTLGDLYQGTEEEKQGVILIDAHYAANAVGVTCTARPEDTDIAPDGSLYIAFTSGTPGSNGGPDKEVFQGPKGETPWEYGWIIHLTEDENAPEAMTFTWKSLAVGGEPEAGGNGFANPDNLAFDSQGNLWMVTDMSTFVQNQPVPSRTDEEGKPLSQQEIQGIFGSNGLWFMGTSGENAGQAYLFATGPIECEMTGPYFSPDEETLFLSVQHPGEGYGVRQDGASEERSFALKTTGGKDFLQTRTVPLGSNWPGKTAQEPPRPAIVAIRREKQ